jgi:hypothetical protein
VAGLFGFPFLLEYSQGAPLAGQNSPPIILGCEISRISGIIAQHNVSICEKQTIFIAVMEI